MEDKVRDKGLWGGRFAARPDPSMHRLSRSTHFDWALVPFDLEATVAHAKALAVKGFLSKDDLDMVLRELEKMRVEFLGGRLKPIDSDEDVHTALERILIERVGEELGGSLRAGRSRNDQIATFVRMYLRDSALKIRKMLIDFLRTIVRRSEQAGGHVMPGRTHFQHAQPILVAHYLLAHAWPLTRNIQRLDSWSARNKECPYGAGAVAGAGLGLPLDEIANELGFESECSNSLDATGSRDHASEFLFICAQIGIDLSRIAEEIVIFSAAEFSYFRLDDAFSTGSSMMPQKKNPDIAELTRGKSGRLVGNLSALLISLKGLPAAYSRDLQEDKEPLFDSVDTLSLVLPAMGGLLESLEFNFQLMEESASRGFSFATDVADYLVRAGMPFKEAHETVGAMVKLCENRGIDLTDLSETELHDISPILPANLGSAVNLNTSIASRSGAGGTSPERVSEQRAKLVSMINRFDETS